MELSQDRLSFTRIAFKSVGIVAVPSNYSHPSAYDPSLHAKFVDESRVDTVNPGAALLARHLFVHKNTVTHRVGGGRTLRIAFVGDAQEFDGQKAHMASEVRKFVGAGFHVKYINTVCGSDDGRRVSGFCCTAFCDRLLRVCLCVCRANTETDASSRSRYLRCLSRVSQQ
jgi:hypothetical protein